eukprot:SAG25_NODE_4894_length_735_cov_1.138365_1_plen_56_part_00
MHGERRRAAVVQECNELLKHTTPLLLLGALPLRLRLAISLGAAVRSLRRPGGSVR